MTNIELLRNAKVGDKFLKGNGDVLEIVEMPPFDDKGYPESPWGKMTLNGISRTWNSAFIFFKSVFDADDGLTPIPAEPFPYTLDLPNAAGVLIALGRITREEWDAAGKLTVGGK